MQSTWHILGPGAIGSLFACHLQGAGFPTVLIGRESSTVPATILLQEDNAPQRFSFASDCNQSSITHLLITVKAHQTEAALAPLKHRLNSASQIVLMQNGMGAWKHVNRICPDSECLLATTTEGAYRPAPGEVIHAGRGDTFIGALTANLQPKAQQLCSQWSRLELTIQEDQNILYRLWQKLAINCAINPLTVIYDCPNGELLNNSKALEQMEMVCGEVEAVMAKALGQAAPNLFELATKVAEKTARNLSSMLQDARNQRETEIDYITGFLLNQARGLGLTCPHNQKLYDQIKR